MKDKDTPLGLVRAGKGFYDTMDIMKAAKGSHGLDWPNFCDLPVSAVTSLLSKRGADPLFMALPPFLRHEADDELHSLVRELEAGLVLGRVAVCLKLAAKIVQHDGQEGGLAGPSAEPGFDVPPVPQIRPAQDRVGIGAHDIRLRQRPADELDMVIEKKYVMLYEQIIKLKL